MVVRRFRAAGPDAGTIVWIHGLGEWSPSFDAIARHALFAGYAHALPDLPGYGRSPSALVAGTNDTVTALADHLAAWLRDRPPAIVVGHSMGGVIATLVAEQLPVRAVVNIDGNLTRGDCTFSAQAEGYTRADFRAHGFAAMRAAVYERGASEFALRSYHAGMLATDPDVFHANATDLVALSTRDDLAPRFARLACPTLFVAGVPRGICEASRARLDAVGARWIGLEPSGHWPFIDQSEAFASAVSRFLATTGSSAT